MLVVLIIAVVVLACFWRPIIKLAMAALIVGFLFLLVSGLSDVMHILLGIGHSLHALIW